MLPYRMLGAACSEHLPSREPRRGKHFNTKAAREWIGAVEANDRRIRGRTGIASMPAESAATKNEIFQNLSILSEELVAAPPPFLKSHTGELFNPNKVEIYGAEV